MQKNKEQIVKDLFYNNLKIRTTYLLSQKIQIFSIKSKQIMRLVKSGLNIVNKKLINKKII